MDYLIYLTKQDNPEHEIITRKIINMFELIFRIKNGIKCDCDENGDTFMSYDEIYEEFSRREQQLKKENTNIDSMAVAALLYELRKCPKCKKDREDLIRYNSVTEHK